MSGACLKGLWADMGILALLLAQAQLYTVILETVVTVHAKICPENSAAIFCLFLLVVADNYQSSTYTSILFVKLPVTPYGTVCDLKSLGYLYLPAAVF